MRLLGLLIAVGIVMYLTVSQMNEDNEKYAVPCLLLKKVVKEGDTSTIDHLIVDHNRDRGVSRVALAGRAAECAEQGWLSEDEAQRFLIDIVPQ